MRRKIKYKTKRERRGDELTIIAKLPCFILINDYIKQYETDVPEYEVIRPYNYFFIIIIM